VTNNEFIPTDLYIPEGPTAEEAGPYYNGVATRSRDETLADVWGGGSDSNTPKGNTVGMRATWTEGNLTPTQAPGPGDLGGFKATTATGAPISDLAALSPNDLVTISGETMPLEVAMHIGLLVRDQKSGLITTTGGHEAQPDAAKETQRDEQQNDSEAPSALDDTSEAILTEAFQGAMGETLSAANDIMVAGEVSAHNVEQLATRLGLEPDQVVANVEHVRAAYFKEAVSASSRRVGVSPAIAEAALAHARQNYLGDLMQAAEQHIHSGKPNYESFVRDYAQNLDSYAPDFILSSLPGKARRDAGTGQIVVKTRRGEMLWGAAFRAGLVKL
jgi:hypothetical protein